jgi:hypothetical protein
VKNRWTGSVEPVGGEKGCIGFCWENVRERDNLGELGADGNILRWIFRKEDVVAWIDQAQSRDRWQALVNVVINFRIP